MTRHAVNPDPVLPVLPRNGSIPGTFQNTHFVIVPPNATRPGESMSGSVAVGQREQGPDR